MLMTELAANRATDAIAGLLDGGVLRIFGADALLAELTFASPAFPPARGGVAVAFDLVTGTGRETGTATRFVAYTAEGQPVLSDDLANVAGLPGREVTEGGEVKVQNFSIAVGKALTGG